jgi:hypothetical protein
MTPERAYVDYLDDILDAVDKVEQFTRGMDFEQLGKLSRTFHLLPESVIPMSLGERWQGFATS